MSTRKTGEDLARQVGYDVGYKDGLELGLKTMIDRLEHAYIEDEGRPDRGSAKGIAILEVARDLVKYGNDVLSGKIKIGETG